MIKVKNNFLILLTFVSLQFAWGQTKDFDYSRPILGVTDEWHSLALPNTIFDKVKPNLSDIRIYKADSIEVPYLLKVSHTVKKQEKVAFEQLNFVQDAKNSFYTFKLDKKMAVNAINLEFNQPNYDFKVVLQGSNNQKKWFDITTTRVLAIANERIHYKYNKLTFTNSDFAYYRLRVPSKKVKLNKAYLYQTKIQKGALKQYDNTVKTTTKYKQTTLEIALNHKVPVSQIALAVSSDFDYYRPIQIRYLEDSIKTPKGWIRNYTTCYRGTLSSLEKDTISFPSIITNALQIVIDNQDNQPLTLSKTTVLGNLHQLIVHFMSKDSVINKYTLAYGNKKIGKPHYDISYFKQAIPKELKLLRLGEIHKKPKQDDTVKTSFLSNKNLIWILLVLLVLLLGKYTIKMLKKPNYLDEIK